MGEMRTMRGGPFAQISEFPLTNPIRHACNFTDVIYLCHAVKLLGRGGAVLELHLVTNVEMINATEGEEEGELSWQERALCAQTDPEAFFPEKGGSTREAKKVCVGCDVRSECLEYALGHDERFGIWGGLSERERRKLKKLAV